jgi:hypothetical protein
MGLLQGKVQNDTFLVIDSFALPVEGTETRVNAQAEAYEYMVDFQGTSKVTSLTACTLPDLVRRSPWGVGHGMKVQLWTAMDSLDMGQNPQLKWLCLGSCPARHQGF